MVTSVISSESGEIQSPKQREQQVQDILKSDRVIDALVQVLPNQIDSARFARLAMGSLRRNPKLLQCNPQSFLTTVLQCAALGLEPDTPLGHAYLVPFKTEATLIVGYKGYIDLAYRSGVVTSVSANVVRQGDDFHWEEGSEPYIKHIRKADPQTYNQGRQVYKSGRDITHAYAIARLLGGGHVQAVMMKSELDAIRSRSRAAHDGPWVTDPVAMYKKTAVRQLTKYMPMSPQARNFHLAAGLYEEAETNRDQLFEVDRKIFDIDVDATAPTTEASGAESDAEMAVDVSSANDAQFCPIHGIEWTLGKHGWFHKADRNWEQINGSPFCNPTRVVFYVARERFGESESDQANFRKALNQFLKQAANKTASKLEPEDLVFVMPWINEFNGSDAAPEAKPEPAAEPITLFPDAGAGNQPWPE